jgi:hypothetical protein
MKGGGRDKVTPGRKKKTGLFSSVHNPCGYGPFMGGWALVAFANALF